MPRQIRKPRNIDYPASASLQSRTATLAIDLPPGWELYVTDSNTGYARENSKTCTVPLWAFNMEVREAAIHDDDPEYAVYYAAHEAAHAWVFVGGDAIENHGEKFYEWFKKLCPPNLWHHELKYRTREATKAGISSDPAKNVTRNDYVPNPRVVAAPTPNDLDDIIAQAVALEPRLENKLAAMPEHERKSFVRGYFNKGFGQ